MSMACSRFVALALLGVVDVCHSVTILADKSVKALHEQWRASTVHDRKSSRFTPQWIEDVSHVLPVNDDDYDYFASVSSDRPDPTNPHHTVVVTFAGKKNTEYIDGAVMLGTSVQKNLPGYPMAAMIIENMHRENQLLLRGAGWKLITVPNWDREYCGDGCDMEFLGRWHDSFEKINAFRLPFKRVLFLDSDTYVFRTHVKFLTTNLKLPSEDHIAMAKDGCKAEYNSGVMVFRPNLTVFRSMLMMVSQRRREEILDQSLINSYYSDKIVEVGREFNCVDTIGIQPGQTQPCEHHCSWNAVVAHFTGHPKPTAAKRRQLELVRRPGAPELACMHTNFGSCGKWSEFYCEMRTWHQRLSPELKSELQSLGKCCHNSMVSRKEAKYAKKHGLYHDESCTECPATVKLWAPNPNLTMIAGSYMKTTIPSRKFNGGRPIFINRDRDMKNDALYLFFMQEQMAWAIGANYRSTSVYGFSSKEAQCPRDTGLWFFHNGTGFERKKLNIRRGHNWKHAPKDTDHLVWNIHRRKWERENFFWEHGHLEQKVTANGTAASGQEEDNATENEETDVENGTNDTVEEDDKNATEDEDADADENETTESGDEDVKNENEDIDAWKFYVPKLQKETTVMTRAVAGPATVLPEKDGKNATEIQGPGAANLADMQKQMEQQAEEIKRLQAKLAGAAEGEGKAPSDEEMHGIQLVPYTFMQQCVQLFRRVMRW